MCNYASTRRLGLYGIQWSNSINTMVTILCCAPGPSNPDYRDENGNSSVKGPSSTENFSKSSIRTSFNVCRAVASNTTLSVSVAANGYIPWHDRIPKLLFSVESLQPSLNPHAPATALRQTPKPVFKSRSDQVVASRLGIFKEFFCYNSSDGMRIWIQGRVVAVSESHESDPGRKESQTTTKHCCQ